MRHRHVIASLITLLATITSCAGPIPTTTPVTSATGHAAAPPARRLPHSGAPPVARPLPDSVVAGDPCTDALSTEQLTTALGTAPGGKGDYLDGLDPGCNWSNLDSGGSLGVTYTTDYRQGLSSLYANTRPQALVWQELTVRAFPAVAHVTSSGGPVNEFCAVDVGISDEVTVGASIFLGTRKKGRVTPCPVAAQVADMVLDTLLRRAGR